MRYPTRVAAGAALLCSLVFAGAGVAGAQVAMPDASQLSGVPLPAPDLANGTVTVRVVRERMGNNVVGQDVTLTTPDGRVSGVTDGEGRAEFSSVAPGSDVVAEATVDGELLRSQPFPVPARGGVRVALVAGIARAAQAEAAANAEAAKQPARAGAVVFGADTRIVLEFQDDEPTFFYIFSIVNNARTPVNPAAPLVLRLPDDAVAASLVSGPPGLARVESPTVTLSGPFPPGQTAFQIAFRLPLSSTIRLTQAWPAPVEGILVATEKAGTLTLSSPQLSGNREGESNGQVFIVGTGGRLADGQPLEVTFANVPAHATWPYWTAAVVTGAGVLWVVWAVLGTTPDRRGDAASLLAERERLLGAIAALDAETRARGADPKRTARRERLMTAAEQVYARIEELSGGAGTAA